MEVSSRTLHTGQMKSGEVWQGTVCHHTSQMQSGEVWQGTVCNQYARQYLLLHLQIWSQKVSVWLSQVRM